METATQILHRLTSYEPGREWDETADDPGVLQDFEPNDPERFPWFFKHYADSLPRVELPRKLPRTRPPALGVLAGTARTDRTELDLAQLSRLLHLSAGIVRTTVRPNGRIFLYRAAGSAGGRFPMELYVAVPEGGRLPPGVHWYHPKDHALIRIAPAPRGDAPALCVTGVPWRTGWRYRERGYRHIYWDTGTMLAQLLAAADSAGLKADLYTRFRDVAVAELVGADGVHEWPVAVVACGENEPILEPTGPPAEGRVDADPLEFPLITQAQRSGRLEALEPPWGRGAPVNVAGPDDRTVEEVVLARGSQRLMERSKALSKDVLEISMRVALRGVTVPHFVVVHNVNDVEPGLYRWPDLSGAVRKGDLREDLYRIALYQDLASDAAFVVIGATDISELDDREYREAQLIAGIVEGRLHLLAYALGASASGMTFLDYEIPALLNEQLAGLLLTCVGVPEYQSARGGPPGEPRSIRTVTPRLG